MANEYYKRYLDTMKGYLSTKLADRATRIQQKLEEQGYMNPSQGSNLVAAPENYLERAYAGKIKEEPMHAGKGGHYKPIDDSITLNSEVNFFNPGGSLVHEMDHAKDWTQPSSRKNIETEKDAPWWMDKNKAPPSERAKDYMYQRKLLEDRLTDMLENEGKSGFAYLALTGQKDPDEIAAQLKEYESYLPAGMNIFQSPIGKKLFPDKESKKMWLQMTTNSMSDQKYLEEIEKKNKK